MTVESGIRDNGDQVEYSIRSTARLPPESIPYILPTLDAVIILLACLAGGVGYHLVIGDPFEILPLCAVGLLSSLIYILRMNGNDYYEFQESAKPQLEVRQILVFAERRPDCLLWLSKGAALPIGPKRRGLGRL